MSFLEISCYFSYDLLFLQNYSIVLLLTKYLSKQIILYAAISVQKINDVCSELPPFFLQGCSCLAVVFIQIHWYLTLFPYHTMFFLFNSNTTCTTAHPYTAPQFIRCLCCSIFFVFVCSSGRKWWKSALSQYINCNDNKRKVRRYQRGIIRSRKSKDKQHKR